MRAIGIITIVILMVCLTMALFSPGPAISASSATASQDNPTSIAMQVKIFCNPITSDTDVRKQELEKDFNKWMQDNWEDINIDRIDMNSNTARLYIVVLYKLKYNK